MLAGLTVQAGLTPPFSNARWDRALWDHDHWDAAGPVQTDITNRVITMEINRGRSDPSGHYEAGTATLTLWNPDAALSPMNPDVTVGVDIAISWDDAPGGAAPVWLFTGTSELARETYAPGADYCVVAVSFVDGFGMLSAHDTPEQAEQGSGELSGARMARILTAAGWLAGSRIDAGQVTMQPTTLAAGKLEELWITADSEGGEIFIGPDGAFVFEDRQRPFVDPRQHKTTWAATDGSSAGIKYKDLALTADKEQIRNLISVARVGGVAAVAESLPSQSRFGIRAWNRHDLRHNSETDSAVLAGVHLERFAFATPHVESLTFDLLAASPADTRTLLDTRLGDRITINRRHPAGNVWAGDFQVRHISQRLTPSGWDISFGVSNAIESADVGQWDRSRWDDGSVWS